MRYNSTSSGVLKMVNKITSTTPSALLQNLKSCKYQNERLVKYIWVNEIAWENEGNFNKHGVGTSLINVILLSDT